MEINLVFLASVPIYCAALSAGYLPALLWDKGAIKKRNPN